MEESTAVRDGLLGFYRRFSSGDPERFAEGIASEPGVSVQGSAPDEGHGSREEWIAAYRAGVVGSGMRLEGGDPSAWEEGSVGFALDHPAFVMTDGGRLPTRLTAVLRRESGDWKVVHLHFSVGVPDEDALEPPP